MSITARGLLAAPPAPPGFASELPSSCTDIKGIRRAQQGKTTAWEPSPKPTGFNDSLRALCGIGAETIKLYGADWKNHLTGIAVINWSKKNHDWENVCMVANLVVANRQARLATKAYLKRKVGLPVSESEQKSISVLTSKEEQANNGGESDGPLTTKQWDSLLIEVLKALDGKCRKPDAETEAYRRMKPIFDQNYGRSVGEGIPAWKKQLQFARQRACNKGYVESPEKVGVGIWQLTRTGWDFVTQT